MYLFSAMMILLIVSSLLCPATGFDMDVVGSPSTTTVETVVCMRGSGLAIVVGKCKLKIVKLDYS